MEKTKGLVMRTSAKVTIILTAKGDYIEISTPKEPPLVGQTIEVALKPLGIPWFHNSWRKYSTVAAALLLVLSITAFYLFIPNMAVASVALDINQGVELMINKDGKVINVRDVNGGSSIIEGLSIKGLDVYQAVNLIVEKAHNKEMLNETKNLVLASVVPLNKWGNQLIDTEKLRNAIRDDLILRNQSGSVFVGQTSQAIQQEARQLGMTVNSYQIYDRCKENGIIVQPETLRIDVQKALLDANVSISSLFPEEGLEVIAQNGMSNSNDTQHKPTDQKASEHIQPSDKDSKPTENHGDTNDSENQSHSPVIQPSPDKSHDMSERSSDHSSLIQPPTATSHD
ncbi:anti-sigma factor domain-containing protein [Desulfosporosinus fructosivorans]|uniref:Anti-sigma factor domain-containing protein n=1 Tax=Desulfosporosinus fructosivorans TaxID=2018669 RepID=A0A4Z0R5M2_9FIRM|nr:anti-sigma factor domain-containing protein [Desulfosporosinus fructosivorans]TGE37297.1 anti-sigma factor domain-containing protein [Desulfosporosinus fructosivorans]